MRIRELFTIPEGKKVNEKVFGRVLLSSIFSILLYMACLAGTTWAWFTVSIQNPGNVIQIATVTANVDIQDKENNAVASATGGKYTLEKGTYTAQIELENDATESKSTVFVVISTAHDDETAYYFLPFENGSKKATQEFRVGADSSTVSFAVSWVAPASATSTAVNGDAIIIGEVSNVSESESSEETTAPITEPSTELTVATNPFEETTASTEEIS